MEGGMKVEKQFVDLGDVTLHVVIAGAKDGKPVILLHGFPEFWYCWRKQIPYLAEKGFRVIVPDQRGYNLSDKPKKIADYKIGLLAQDVVNLATALGYERFHLVGHDWGAAVAWWTALLFPERLHNLAILNVPFPSVMNQELRQGNWQQLLKSWYIFYFQIPYLPEWALSVDDFAPLVRAMMESGKEGSFTPEEMEAYKRAWAQPSALRSMVNWYRAAGQSASDSNPSSSRQVQIIPKTLILWGEQDKFLGKELAEKSLEVCRDGRLIFYPNATHWLQIDEADAVNQELASFFGE
jgi:pimeloyl-ACP methyl ester carboxylesterase